VGRQLLEIAFLRAREERLPLVVFSEPAAREFFGSLGFKEVGSAEIDLANFAPRGSRFGVFRLTGMVWRP
jgi:N-acetylglutamate synthase-like GNAT family acetyltransferase